MASKAALIVSSSGGAFCHWMLMGPKCVRGPRVILGDVGLYGVVIEALGAQQQLGGVLGIPGPAAGLDPGLGGVQALADGPFQLVAQGAVLDTLHQGLLFRMVSGPGGRRCGDDSEQHDGKRHPLTGPSSPYPPLHALADIMPRPWSMTV